MARTDRARDFSKYGHLARGFRVMAYSMLTIAGPMAILYTPPSLAETMGPQWTAVWGIFLFVGALGCLVGSITDMWIGEFLFLNLLGSAIAVYAGFALSTALDGSDPGRFAGGLCLLALDLLFADRLFSVIMLGKASQRAALDVGRHQDLLLGRGRETPPRGHGAD